MGHPLINVFDTPQLAAGSFIWIGPVSHLAGLNQKAVVRRDMKVDRGSAFEVETRVRLGLDSPHPDGHEEFDGFP